MIENRMVYFISVFDRASDGGFIPCIAVEGEKGYYRTDWNWGTDQALAQRLADEHNESMGYSEADVLDVILSTLGYPDEDE